MKIPSPLSGMQVVPLIVKVCKILVNSYVEIDSNKGLYSSTTSSKPKCILIEGAENDTFTPLTIEKVWAPVMMIE